jgi:putative hemolysin
MQLDWRMNMYRYHKWWVGLMLLLASCSIPITESQAIRSPTERAAVEQAGLPNPASVYCEERDYRLELRVDAEGGAYGICIFPDESECDEWAYYRGECMPTAVGTAAPTRATDSVPGETVSYASSEYGFAFEYPATWRIEEVPQALMLSRDEVLIYIAYKTIDDPWVIHWTGMPEGEWEKAGQVPFLGEMLQKTLLVFAGKVKVVIYTLPEETPSISGLDVRVRVDDRTGRSYDEMEIAADLQAEVEQILASFQILHEEELFPQD